MAGISKGALFYKSFEELKKSDIKLATYVQADLRYPKMVNEYLDDEDVELDDEGQTSFDAWSDRHDALGFVFDNNDAALKTKANEFYASIENNIAPTIEKHDVSVEAMFAPLDVEPENTDLSASLTRYAQIKAIDEIGNTPVSHDPNGLQTALNENAEIRLAKLETPAVAEPAAKIIPAIFVPDSIPSDLKPVFDAANAIQVAVAPEPIMIAPLKASFVTVSNLPDLPKKVEPEPITLSPIKASFVTVSALPDLPKAVAPEPEEPAMTEYTVKRGDSLDKILYATYGKDLQGRNIAELRKEIALLPENDDVLGADNKKYRLQINDPIFLPASVAKEEEKVAPIPQMRPMQLATLSR